jgi:hypothetical protein
MTAIAPTTAPSLQQLAPHVAPRVKDGDLAGAQLGLLAVGVVLVAAAWLTAGEHFYVSYLVGYMGVLGICLGALFFVMLQHITRAGWSVVVRRVAENVAATLPVMLLLFVPILVGFDEIFHHWAHANVDPVTHQAIAPTDPKYDTVLAGKTVWLNKPFFVVRVCVYFAVWIGLALFFRAQSIKQDDTGDPAINLRLSRFAAPGLLLFALSTTFAAFDWIMSVDPHWFSTIFGVAYFAGGFMSFLAFAILFVMWLGKRGYLRGAVTTEHYHDLGKLMFAFMVFWTYANFSQYMLIWYANLPEETRWFADRSQHGWGSIGTLLILGHFLVPFAFLMSRHVKRSPVGLAAGAIFLLVIHCFDMQYLILPSAGPVDAHAEHAAPATTAHAATASQTDGHASAGALVEFTKGLPDYLHQVHWADFGCFAALLAIVAGATLFHVRRANLLPVRDPRLAESLHFQNH